MLSLANELLLVKNVIQRNSRPNLDGYTVKHTFRSWSLIYVIAHRQKKQTNKRRTIYTAI